jgi:RNA polymerase sigma-70 factor, ECF subfamily
MSVTEWDGWSQSSGVEPAVQPLDDIPIELEVPDFHEVYKAHFTYVWHSLRRIGVPDADLEDLCHDVFIAFYRGLDSYDPARPIKPWLFGIAFRVASDHRRRARNRFEVQKSVEVADRAPAADERVAERQARSLVAAALAALSDDKRAVFILHEIDEQSMPEIAAVIDAPLNTLYSRLRLARAEFAAAVRRLLGTK